VNLEALTNNLKSGKLNIVWPSVVRQFYFLKDKVDYDLSCGIAKVGDIILTKLVNPRVAEIEFPNGRIGIVYKNQLIVGALGYRRTTISYVGVIPNKGIKVVQGNKIYLSLLSKSGLVGVLASKSVYFPNPPKVELIALFKSRFKNLNLTDFALRASGNLHMATPLLIVAGSSSECGKTTVCSHLIRALINNGFKVSAAKLTGAGSMRDKLKFVDSGASPVYDFVDGGLASTPDRYSIIPVAKNILSKIIETGRPDIIIIELAGSLLIEANKAILLDKEIRKNLLGVIFVSNDEIGAIGGLYILQKNYNLRPLFFSGKATDTITGIEHIYNETGIPAINFENTDEMVKVLKDKLKKGIVKK